MLRSLDHGASWQRFGVPPAGEGSNDLRDIEALDERHAWVISITEPARVLATTDGGLSWDELFVSDDPASFFDSIALFGPFGAERQAGVVFGDPRADVFEVLRSDDGREWQRVAAERLPAAMEGEAAFAASGTCVVTHGPEHAWIGTGGTHARVLRTSDGGRSWTAAETPLRQGQATAGIYSVAFRDEHRGVIIGGAYDAPELGGDNAAWTEDGGATWHPADVAPLGYRSGVVWLDDETLLAVGRAGSSYSLDSGQSWRTLSDPAGYYAVSVAPDGEVIAVGADGRAARLRFQ